MFTIRLPMLERRSNDLTLFLVSEKRCLKKDNSLRLSEGFDDQEKEMTDTCATLFRQYIR